MSTYASKYHVTFDARDGYTYRVEIQRRGWTGSSTEILGGPSPYRLRMGAQGGRSLFDPIRLSEVELSIIDRDGYGIMQEIAGAGERAYRVVLIRLGSPDTVLYRHFLDTQSHQEAAHLATKVVRLRGTDGLDILASRRLQFAGTGLYRYETIGVLDIIRQALQAVGAASFVTSMHWYPWRSDPITGSPLEVLRLYRRLFDTRATQDRLIDALRAVLSPFLMTLFQGSGTWYILQRGSLTGAALEGTEYDIDGSLSTGLSVPLAVESADISERAEPVRLYRPKMRSVAQEFRHEPREEYVYNGDFRASPSGMYGIDASGWEPLSDYENLEIHSRRVILREGPRGAPTTTYAWRLRDISEQTTPVPAPNRVEQSGRYLITASPSAQLTFAYTITNVPTGQTMWPATVNARAVLRVGNSSVQMTFAEVIRSADSGDQNRLIISPVAEDVLGVVEETPLIPRGAQLGVWDGDELKGVITVDRDIRALETSILYSGDVSIDEEDEIAIPVWVDSGILWARDPAAHVPVTLYMNRPDGTPVSGWLLIRFYGRYIPGVIADNVDIENVSVTLDGEGSGTVWQVSDVVGDGYDDTLPASIIGDAPVSSASSITIDSGGSTWRGQDTGWKLGSYETEEATTGTFLTALAAREALYQQAAILDRIQTTLLLRDGQEYHPHNVLNYRQAARISYAAMAGADYIVTPTRLRPGRMITIGGETHTVTEVTGGGPYRADLDGALASSYAQGTRVFYTTPMWWDFLDWDVRSGEMYFDGTELYRREVPYEADILIEGE